MEISGWAVRCTAETECDKMVSWTKIYRRDRGDYFGAPTKHFLSGRICWRQKNQLAKCQLGFRGLPPRTVSCNLWYALKIGSKNYFRSRSNASKYQWTDAEQAWLNKIKIKRLIIRTKKETWKKCGTLDNWIDLAKMQQTGVSTFIFRIAANYSQLRRAEPLECCTNSPQVVARTVSNWLAWI